MVKKLAAVLVVAVLVVGLGIEIWRTTHEGSPAGPLQTVLRGINAQGDMTGYTSHTVHYDGGESWLLTAAQGHGFLLRHGTYVSIDGPPGATGVYPAHVSPEGDVVGTYDGSDGHQHGFLWRHGASTPIDYPGAAFTVAQGINAAGDIVGWYGDSHAHTSAFELRHGVFSRVDAPGWTASTATAINAAGDIVGTYDDHNYTHQPFLWRHGTVTATAPRELLCIPEGLTDRDDVVEECQGAVELALWRHGTFTAIDLRALGMPMDPTDGTTLAQEVGSVVAGDVSPQGDIVGTYRLPDPKQPYIANTKTPNLIYHGFLWHNGRFTTIDAH